MPRYDGRCRSLTGEEAAKLESEGQRPVLRFRVEGRPIPFEDLIHGRMNFNPGDIGDFIIVRSDGMAAYNFACVIDDHFMQMTHVIRGEDHLSNTPRQVMIYQALRMGPSCLCPSSSDSGSGPDTLEQTPWRNRRLSVPGRGFFTGGPSQLPRFSGLGLPFG